MEAREKEATDNPLSAGSGAIQTTVKRGFKVKECDIIDGVSNGTPGLKAAGLQKILENQAQLSAEIRSIDAGGVMARASEAESAAAASAVRAAESAALAGGAAEVATAAQPLLDALQRMEARLTAIEAKQNASGGGCCVLM